MADSDMVVVNNGGKAAWFVAGLVACAAIVAAVLYSQGYFDRSQSIELKIEVPKIDVN